LKRRAQAVASVLSCDVSPFNPFLLSARGFVISARFPSPATLPCTPLLCTSTHLLAFNVTHAARSSCLLSPALPRRQGLITFVPLLTSYPFTLRSSRSSIASSFPAFCTVIMFFLFSPRGGSSSHLHFTTLTARKYRSYITLTWITYLVTKGEYINTLELSLVINRGRQ